MDIFDDQIDINKNVNNHQNIKIQELYDEIEFLRKMGILMCIVLGAILVWMLIALIYDLISECIRSAIKIRKRRHIYINV